jgi:hypothetical protein
LVAVAVVWIVTRGGMIALDWSGPVGHVFSRKFTGDINLYQHWLRQYFAYGSFPGNDIRWQYPPGAAAVIALPRLLPLGYPQAFILVAAAADMAITVLLVRMARIRGSWLGCWCWLAGIPLIGPIELGRFDVFAALLAVAALAFADSAWGLGVFSGLGALVKVWPGLLLIGARDVARSVRAAALVVIAGLVVVGLTTGGSFGFLTHQGSRGIEVEALGAMPFVVLRVLGMHDWRILHGFGAFQVTGPGIVAAADVSLAATVVAFGVLVWMRWRARAWTLAATGDFGLVATLAMVTTSRVISPQYMIWLIAMAAGATVFPRSSQRPVVILIIPAVALSQLDFPFHFPGLLAFHALSVAVVASRDVLLVAATLFGFVLLSRSTRGHEPAEPATGPDDIVGACYLEQSTSSGTPRPTVAKATSGRALPRSSSRPPAGRAARLAPRP